MPPSSRPRPLPTTRPAALLFDLDGTLVNTEPLHFASVIQVLEQCGVAFDQSTYAPYFGWAEVPFWEDLKRVLPLTTPVPELVTARSEAYLQLLHATSIKPLPGVLELLDWAQRVAVPMAVASSSPRQQIDASLAAAGLADALPIRRSGHDDVVHGKPAPDVFHAAAEALGVATEEAWAFEDSPTGMAAARASGAFTIGVVEAAAAGNAYPHADYLCHGGIPHWLEQMQSLGLA